MMMEHDARAQQYRTLIEVSRAIASHRDLSELFHALSDCLHRLLTFNYLSVVLHDDVRQTMRLHILESADSQSEDLGVEFAIEDSPSGFVWDTQQTLNVLDIDDLQKFSKVTAILRKHGVRSFCSLPLTTAHRRIGALAFGRAETGGYHDPELEFARLVADPIAVAIDNALHYDEAITLQHEVEHQRDRLQLVLEINNSVVSNLELHALFQALSASLKRVVPHDSACLLLPDPQKADTLRIHALEFPEGRGFLQQDMAISMLHSNAGRVFREKQPLLVGAGPGFVPYVPADGVRIASGEGLRSSLVLPLVADAEAIGVLALASRTEQAFRPSDVEFLQQLARQIAIGVNNGLRHHALSESRDRIVEQKSYLEEEIRAEQDFEDIVGTSSVLRAVLQQVETVAPTDSTVLIEGETGTGKELIARAIHDRSSRRDRTFVKINCAAIPLGLLESELFGHERGAFTGAIARKLGRFELANHGTLFLDEIGDVPLELQPKLLRVLQEQEFERLGSNHTQKVDVRVIAATHRNLRRRVEADDFRGDLYYRINVFPIAVPPLRQRREDIPLLARYFTSKYARRMKRRIERIPEETLEALMRYDWPGNVRELQNFIERAVILSLGTELRAPLPELKLPAVLLKPDFDTRPTLRDMERQHILDALRLSNWVVGGPSGAAVRLGMKRTSLLYRMEKLGISRAASNGDR